MSAELLLVLRIILAISLYAFLALAIYTLWATLRQTSKSLAEPQVIPIMLTRLGPAEQVPENFAQPTVLIGRDPASDCQLEEPTVSARHARLSFHHGQWWVEDLHSRNGTFINLVPVKEPVVIADGDQLKCGEVKIYVQLTGSSSDKEVSGV